MEWIVFGAFVLAPVVVLVMVARLLSRLVNLEETLEQEVEELQRRIGAVERTRPRSPGGISSRIKPEVK